MARNGEPGRALSLGVWRRFSGQLSRLLVLIFACRHWPCLWFDWGHGNIFRWIASPDVASPSGRLPGGLLQG
jgi:hypothetical protein